MHRHATTVPHPRRLRSHVLPAFTVAACLGAAVTAAADEALTVRAIAPVNTFVIAYADDVRGSVERFKKTPLYDLWMSDTVQSAVAEEMKKFHHDLAERLQELGLPEDTLSWPLNIGMAVAAERVEETDELVPAVFMLADWGDDADRMNAFFEANISELSRESPERVSTTDVRGRRVTVIELPNGGHSDPDDFMPPDPMEQLGSMERLCFVREGSRFLLTSSVTAMEEALTAVDVPPAKQVTEEEDVREALTQLGGGDAVAILRTGPLQPFVEQNGGGMMAIVSPVVTQLVGDIQAFGFSTTIDGQVGMLESAITIFTPGGRKGLLALFSESPVGAAPPFIPSDAIGYGRMNVAFGDLMKVVEATVAGLPGMYAQNIDPMLQQYGPILTRAFAALGPEVHTYTTVTQPITLESRRTTTAIACSDEQAVLPLLNLFAPQHGMEARDFLGQTIYGSEMMPMAIGIGGGQLVIGSTPSVEQTLRATGQGGAAATPPAAETTAMAHLPPGRVIGWGWYDTVAELDYSRQVLMSMEGDDDGMQDFVDDQGDAIDDLVGVELPTKVVETMRKLDPEFLSRYLGPQLWTFGADSKGLAYRFSLLRPKPAEPK